MTSELQAAANEIVASGHKTLRDEMAMAAMSFVAPVLETFDVDDGVKSLDDSVRVIATIAYKIADAMLAARQEGGAV